MAFQKKTWVDRLVEFPGRRLLRKISASDTEMVVDVYRNEGDMSREGDAYNAANMNDLETRIADEFSQLYSDIQKVIEIGNNPSPKDINKYTKTGFYAIGNIGGYTNLPVQSAGILIVFSTGTYFFQIYSTVITNLLYYRSGENNRFNPWMAIT